MYIHIFDRSDSDAIDHAKTCPCPRSDVVLINNTRSDKEYTLYVTRDGFSGDMWILDILSDKQYRSLQAIALRMRYNAKLSLDAAKYVVLTW